MVCLLLSVRTKSAVDKFWDKDKKLKVMIQVNISGETSKAGKEAGKPPVRYKKESHFETKSHSPVWRNMSYSAVHN